MDLLTQLKSLLSGSGQVTRNTTFKGGTPISRRNFGPPTQLAQIQPIPAHNTDIISVLNTPESASGAIAANNARRANKNQAYTSFLNSLTQAGRPIPAAPSHPSNEDSQIVYTPQGSMPLSSVQQGQPWQNPTNGYSPYGYHSPQSFLDTVTKGYRLK